MIERVEEACARLRVTHVRPDGETLGAQKSLNFPNSSVQLLALSKKDLRDLDFAVQHADIIGLSFVQCADDIDRLAESLAKRKVGVLGVIAKIETRLRYKTCLRLSCAGRDMVHLG